MSQDQVICIYLQIVFVTLPTTHLHAHALCVFLRGRARPCEGPANEKKALRTNFYRNTTVVYVIVGVRVWKTILV